ncbi:MAG TPA: oligogalacturonate-specific porin KdgM family protein, partial [Puia sp.]|nr:oligogalacturonate-specific porin KdgM family protein [Puia sp.]
IAALILFGGLIMLKLHLAADAKNKASTEKAADIPSLENRIKSDSLYIVKDILYKDSGILIALDNPGKSGAETYFDKKFKLNDYSNINMVYIYQYDTTKPLQQISLDDAIMAKGKKMARFQEIWVAKYIDTTDGSCKPLKKYLQSTIKNTDIFQTEETSYQPESIHKMRVECKYKITDSLGKKTDNDITASVDTAGLVTLVDKPQ